MEIEISVRYGRAKWSSLSLRSATEKGSRRWGTLSRGSSTSRRRGCPSWGQESPSCESEYHVDLLRLAALAHLCHDNRLPCYPGPGGSPSSPARTWWRWPRSARRCGTSASSTSGSSRGPRSLPRGGPRSSSWTCSGRTSHATCSRASSSITACPNSKPFGRSLQFALTPVCIPNFQSISKQHGVLRRPRRRVDIVTGHDRLQRVAEGGAQVRPLPLPHRPRQKGIGH